MNRPQFNQDYARIFGLPPLEDIAYLRKVINVRAPPGEDDGLRKVAIGSKPPTTPIAII